VILGSRFIKRLWWGFVGGAVVVDVLFWWHVIVSRSWLCSRSGGISEMLVLWS